MKTLQEVVANNPKVDRELAENYAKLEAELNKLGVIVKPKFNITPALGGAAKARFSYKEERDS